MRVSPKSLVACISLEECIGGTCKRRILDQSLKLLFFKSDNVFKCEDHQVQSTTFNDELRW